MARINRKETNTVTLSATFERGEILKMLEQHMLEAGGLSLEQPRSAVSLRVGPDLQAAAPMAPCALVAPFGDIGGSVEVTLVIDLNKLPKPAACAPEHSE